MTIRRLVLTGAMCCMLLGGCGKNDVDMISDYGSEKVVPQEIRITEENERDAVVNPGSEAEAHELFGEGTVKWNETFTAYSFAIRTNPAVPRYRKYNPFRTRIKSHRLLPQKVFPFANPAYAGE